jgi:hypothetical protein
MDLHVPDSELMESILKLPGFHENGQFNQERYRRILSLEKLTLEQFERQQRDEILITKVKNMIRDSAALTPSEIEEMEKRDPNGIEQARQNRLNQKREKVVHAYAMALKKNASVVINNELL